MTIQFWQKEYDINIVNPELNRTNGLYTALVLTQTNEFKAFTSKSLGKVAEFCNSYTAPSAYTFYASAKYDTTAGNEFNHSVSNALSKAFCEAHNYHNDSKNFITCQIFDPAGEELLHFTDELDIFVLDNAILPVLREHFPIVAMSATLPKNK